jgi:hypothetical protein
MSPQGRSEAIEVCPEGTPRLLFDIPTGASIWKALRVGLFLPHPDDRHIPS